MGAVARSWGRIGQVCSLNGRHRNADLFGELQLSNKRRVADSLPLLPQLGCDVDLVAPWLQRTRRDSVVGATHCMRCKNPADRHSRTPTQPVRHALCTPIRMRDMASSGMPAGGMNKTAMPCLGDSKSEERGMRSTCPRFRRASKDRTSVIPKTFRLIPKSINCASQASVWQSQSTAPAMRYRREHAGAEEQTYNRTHACYSDSGRITDAASSPAIHMRKHNAIRSRQR